MKVLMVSFPQSHLTNTFQIIFFINRLIRKGYQMLKKSLILLQIECVSYCLFLTMTE